MAGPLLGATGFGGLRAGFSWGGPDSQPANLFDLEIRSLPLPKGSWVKISQIRTLSTDRLSGHLGRLSPEELQAVVEGLNEIIGE